MKASHRREIFWARLSFAVICLLLVGGIVALILHGVSKRQATLETQEPVTTEDSTQILIMDLGNRETEPETEIPVETEPPVVHYKTVNRVNLRPQPSTEGTPIKTLEAGTVVTLIEEEGDWVHVQLEDQSGYIKKDFVAVVTE